MLMVQVASAPRRGPACPCIASGFGFGARAADLCLAGRLLRRIRLDTVHRFVSGRRRTSLMG